MTDDITTTIADALAEMSHPGSVYLEAPASDAHDASTASVRELTDIGARTIIVSASRPAKDLLREYEDAGIPTDDVFIIDCISANQQSDQPEQDNVFYVETPSALTDISILLTEIIDEVTDDGDDLAVVLDSLNAFQIHNEPRRVGRFAHSLLTKLRLKDVYGVLIGVEDDIDPNVRSQVIQLSDTTLSV